MYKFNPLRNNFKNILNILSRSQHQKLISNNFIKNFSLSSSIQSEDKSKLVTVDQIGGIRIICINRPEKRNCVNVATAEALLQAFKDFDEDEASKVAVLHGAGGNFCAGYDLEEIATTPDIISKVGTERGPMGPTHYETTKPVIGAIEGYAVAGGFELALWCDIRIVEETAIMGVFCRRWGVPLIDGGTMRLPAIVGLGRALDMILTGRPIRAPEALEIGLANHICACGSGVGRAVFYAESLEKYPVEALRADRQSARDSYFSSSFSEAIKKEQNRGRIALEEATIGAAKFAKGEGRHGSFTMFQKKSQDNVDDKN